MGENMVQLTILGSGSSGNCAVLQSAGMTLLLDAGLSARQICLRLESVGLCADHLDGILLTHEHQDHTRGLELLCKNRSLPILCTRLTQEVLVRDIRFRSPPVWRILPTGARFEWGDLLIESFSVPHDAVDPVGYVVADHESRLGLLSDVGHITHLIRDRLTGADSVFVEANYDTRLLDADTRRPWAIKQRISSHHGHLSNHQAAELVEFLAHPNLHHVLLGHLSDDCNNPQIAESHIRSVLDRKGLQHTQVRCALRRTVTPGIEVACRMRSQVKAITEATEVQQMALW